MSIFDNLDKYLLTKSINDNITCYLYMGKYDNNTGNCIVDEIYFNKILEKIKNFISRQYIKEQYKCYKYYDKELRIYKDDRIALVKNPILCNIQKSACLQLYEEYQISLDKFPIIDKYTDIYYVYSKIYTLKNIQQVEITLVNEIYESNKNIYVVYIKFPIKYTENVKKIMEYIFG